MLKAFRDLVDDDVQVSVDTGLRAAEKLQAVLDRCGQGDDVAEMRVQVGRIIDAVKSTVPQEMWGAIIEKLDQNIIFTHLDDDEDSNESCLTDFGIARHVDDISGLTATNMTVGTVAYAAGHDCPFARCCTDRVGLSGFVRSGGQAGGSRHRR